MRPSLRDEEQAGRLRSQLLAPAAGDASIFVVAQHDLPARGIDGDFTAAFQRAEEDLVGERALDVLTRFTSQVFPTLDVLSRLGSQVIPALDRCSGLDRQRSSPIEPRSRWASLTTAPPAPGSRFGSQSVRGLSASVPS